MLRGVLIGSAAALVVAGAIGAAALAGRPPGAEPGAARPDAASRLRITLAEPRQAAPAAGPKLQTLPPGTQNSPLATPRPPPPPPRVVPLDEFGPREPREAEPRARLRDFAQDDDLPAYVEQDPDDGYVYTRPSPRDRRHDRRCAERYAEPYPSEPDPQEPPWRR